MSREAETRPGTASRLVRAGALGIVALCAVLAVANLIEVQIITTAHSTPLTWGQLLALTGPRWALMSGLLILVFGLARRFPIWPPTPRAALVHLAGFAGVAFTHALVSTMLNRALQPATTIFPFWFNVWGMLLHMLLLLVLLYAGALAVSTLVDAALERHARELHASQLQAELSAARLEALRAQLRPHFLYNSLHGIAALIADDQRDRALGATEQLAELLHAAFRDDGRTLIPLAEELELVDRYLALQQMRFADRLTVTHDIEAGLDHALVPPLLLQPLVENAVQHGLEATAGNVTVRLSARAEGDRLRLDVENDGAKIATGWEEGHGGGVGIANTRGRLRTIYGERATLRLTPRDAGGMIATVLIPLRQETA